MLSLCCGLFAVAHGFCGNYVHSSDLPDPPRNSAQRDQHLAPWLVKITPSKNPENGDSLGLGSQKFVLK